MKYRALAVFRDRLCVTVHILYVLTDLLMIDQLLISPVTGTVQSALQPLNTKLISAELNLAHSDNSFWVEFAMSKLPDGGFCSLSCLWGDLEDRWSDSLRFPLNIVYAATVQLLRI